MFVPQLLPLPTTHMPAVQVWPLAQVAPAVQGVVHCPATHSDELGQSAARTQGTTGVADVGVGVVLVVVVPPGVGVGAVDDVVELPGAT